MRPFLIAYFFLIFFASQAQQKNILLIIVDDLKPAGVAYDAPEMLTPNMDALAGEGVLFARNYCQQAVCAPSRISFLTGTRPDVTKVWDLKTDMRTVNPESLTLPEYFKQQGYYTVGTGKVFHGAKNNDPQSWSAPFVTDDELDYALGFELPVTRSYQNAYTRETYDEIIADQTKNKGSNKGRRGINQALKAANARPAIETLDVPDDAYADGAIANKGIEWLKELKDKNQPFFITLGFHKPHLPFVAPQKYWDLYDRESIQVSAFSQEAANSPQYAYHTYGELRNYSDIPQDLGLDGLNGDEAKQKEVIHGYYAAVSYVDAQIGKVLNYLKTANLDENTIVVLLSDHGWHLGDHGIWCKHSNFEQATFTPMIISDPDSKKGIVCESPTELLDVFPTLCDLTSLEQPETLQGKSLQPILSGKAERVKDFALSQYPRGGRMGYALRNERYRYVEWLEMDYRQSAPYSAENIVAVELYDYENDPLETISLQDDPAYKSVRSELHHQLSNFLINQPNSKEITND